MAVQKGDCRKEEGKNLLRTESRLEEGAEELLREFACACLSDRHLASYCVVVHRVETLKVQQSARLMYVFSGEQNVTVFTAKKPILCQ